MTNNQIKVKTHFTKEIKLRMNKWELKFLTSLSSRITDWTEKQSQVFDQLVDKYGATPSPICEVYVGEANATSTIQHITSRKMRKNRGIYSSSNTTVDTNFKKKKKKKKKYKSNTHIQYKSK